MRRWLLLLLIVAAAFAFVVVPVFLFYPFRPQTATGPAVGYPIGRSGRGGAWAPRPGRAPARRTDVARVAALVGEGFDGLAAPAGRRFGVGGTAERLRDDVPGARIPCLRTRGRG